MVNLRSQAYRRTDLTRPSSHIAITTARLTYPELPFDALREKAKDIRIGDGRDYYRYLCILFPGAARAQAPDDESASRRDEFVEKVFYLVSLLDDDQSKFYAFHALIRIAATVFLQKHGRVVDRSKGAAAKANYRVLEIVEKRFMPVTEGLPPSASYYDFAAAYRRLWLAWQESCQHWVPEVMKKIFTCWHKQNGFLLDFIHKKAYSEIRAKGMVTVGTQLPPKRTEKIFDLAMEVEEVSRHAIMLETDKVEIEVPSEMQKVYGEPASRTVTVLRLLWEFCACERQYIKSRGGY